MAAINELSVYPLLNGTEVIEGQNTGIHYTQALPAAVGGGITLDTIMIFKKYRQQKVTVAITVNGKVKLAHQHNDPVMTNFFFKISRKKDLEKTTKAFTFNHYNY